MEYGYAGNVKKIIKTTYNDILKTDSIQIPKGNKADVIETFFINSHQNIDSFLTQRLLPTGDTFSYLRKFHFEELKRKSWEAYSMDNEKLLSGKIDWSTDKEFDEKVFYQTGKLKFNLITSLNDSYRIFYIHIKGFDESGKLTQNSTQEFSFTDSGNLNTLTTTNILENKIEKKTYQYLSKDKRGNPTEMLITKQTDNSSNLIKLEYQYYD
ncbi:MAG: hypothetical protein QM726_11195 [Chitinophagaceae bacterium]